MAGKLKKSGWGPPASPQHSGQVATWAKRSWIPGQVPSRKKLELETLRSAEQAPRRMSVEIMLDDNAAVLSPARIVSNLGLPIQQEQKWKTFLENSVGPGTNEVQARQALFHKFQEDRVDPAMRGEIFRRAMSYVRTLQKSVVEVYSPDELIKAREVTPVGGITPGGYKKIDEETYVKVEPGSGGGKPAASQLDLFAPRAKAPEPVSEGSYSQRVADSLAIAERDNREHRKKHAVKMDLLPEGTVIRSSGGQAYTKETIDGDIFWKQEGRGGKYKGHHTSIQVFPEVPGAVKKVLAEHGLEVEENGDAEKSMLRFFISEPLRKFEERFTIPCEVAE